MSIHVRTTAKGQRRYDVRLRDVAGKEYWRSFRTRKEAERFEASERTDRARGSWIDPRRADTKLSEITTEWLDSHPGKKESTLARDESVLRTHVLPALGHVPVGAITPVEVQRIVTGWSRTLSARSVHRNFAVLRAVFNYAVDTDRIGRSPCRKIKLPEQAPVRHRIASPEELGRLAEALGADLGPMVYVAAILGLR